MPFVTLGLTRLDCVRRLVGSNWLKRTALPKFGERKLASNPYARLNKLNLRANAEKFSRPRKPPVDDLCREHADRYVRYDTRLLAASDTRDSAAAFAAIDRLRAGRQV